MYNLCYKSAAMAQAGHDESKQSSRALVVHGSDAVQPIQDPRELSLDERLQQVRAGGHGSVSCLALRT